MKIDDNVGSRISRDFEGVGEISFEMIEQRAKEIALLNSRAAEDYTDDDWLQAKEELINPQSKSTIPQEKALEKIEAWDQPPSQAGQEVRDVPLEDEALTSEKLVDEGVREAEHERMVEAHKRSRNG